MILLIEFSGGSGHLVEVNDGFECLEVLCLVRAFIAASEQCLFCQNWVRK